jgi:hypothetical protein
MFVPSQMLHLDVLCHDVDAVTDIDVVAIAGRVLFKVCIYSARPAVISASNILYELQHHINLSSTHIPTELLEAYNQVQA